MANSFQKDAQALDDLLNRRLPQKAVELAVDIVLSSFAQEESIDLTIRQHVHARGITNPELLILNKIGDVNRISSVKNGPKNAIKELKWQLAGVNEKQGVLVLQIPEQMDAAYLGQRIKGEWMTRPCITDLIVVRDKSRTSQTKHLVWKETNWNELPQKLKEALK